ncbi:MAG: hypothetical protein M1816_007549 [Peltula sp. TS41687]|nr:MAG: hypothetical protein M1816_007549 [Peltula sp. TS41687]
MMATAVGSDLLKRPRVSWSGSSHPPPPPPPPPHPLQHHPEPPVVPYPNHALPLPVAPPTTYSEHDHRGPPPNVSYNPGSGYVSPMEGIPSLPPPSYAPEQTYARPGGIPIKTDSPGDGHTPSLRTLPVVSEAPQALQPPLVEHSTPVTFADHHPPPPPLESHHGMAMANHDGIPSTHPGSYVPSPVSGGPRDPYYMSGPMYAAAAAVAAGYPHKRKAIRAAQVRIEKLPIILIGMTDSLSSTGLRCVPSTQDRTLLQILQKLDEVHGFLDKLDSVPADLQEMKKYMRPTAINGGAGMTDHSGSSQVVVASTDVRRASLPAGIESLRVSQDTLAIAPKELVQNEVVIKSEEGREGLGELSIPIEHTTAAHKLLRWPSIRKLVDPVTDNEHYVMQGEESRGLLRPWGRGEGVDAPTGSPVNLDQGEDDFLNSASLFPSSDALWGTGPPRLSETRRPAVENLGGLNPDGSLKLDQPTLLRLLRSYQENIHIMHPFLDQERMTQIIYEFGERYQSPASTQPRSPFVVLSPMNSNELRRESVASLGHGVGTKRKRSTTNMPGNSPATSYSGSSGVRGNPPKSIGTALVLLVAALGKICEHKEFLPEPAKVPEYPLDTERVSSQADSSPHYRTNSPAISVRHSPTSSHTSSHTSGASPQDTSHMSYPTRRSSVDAASPVDRSYPFNVDVIPGLAYYAHATEILGYLHGGNELAHVQAGILACLYAGQLARVLESWKWINWACTACQVLVKRTAFPKREKDTLGHLGPGPNNPVVVAFWTCLQLESDILAELDLPPSGITRYEELMPFPKVQKSLIWTYYTAQIGLRKLLNRVHFALYKPQNDSSKNSGWSIGELKELEAQLSEWRTMLPPELQWEDSEPPPADINAARLRAKYYGARYVIHRPFLHHAIHPIEQREQPFKIPGDTPPTEYRRSSTYGYLTRPTVSQAYGGGESMPPPPTAGYGRLDDTVLKACKNCISAAMKSTAAFHGIDHRPIVTNIFGTAHACVSLAEFPQTPLTDHDPTEQAIRQSTGFAGGISTSPPERTCFEIRAL